MRNITYLIVSVVVIGLLALQIQRNVLEIGGINNFDSFQMDSEQSVRLMVERVDRDGWKSTGGMVLGRDLNGEPYESIWGLQGKIVTLGWCGLFNKVTTLPEYFTNCQIVNSFFLAGTLCWFAWFVAQTFGVIPAITFLVFSSLSLWMVFAGRNMYLVYWLNLLPFMASMAFHPLRDGAEESEYSDKSCVRFCILIGTLVFIKSLCSLDYCSNVVLSTACGPIFWGIYRKRSFIDTILDSLAVILFSAGVVALAILATAIQAGIYEGSLFEGFRQLYVAASSRSYGGLDPTRCASPDISLLKIIDAYLTLPVIAFPFDRAYHIYTTIFALVFTLLALSLSSFLKDDPKTRALLFTTWWGFICTSSWAILMKGHMAHHLHMNGMIFYIPFALLAYILIGCFFNRKWGRKC